MRTTDFLAEETVSHKRERESPPPPLRYITTAVIFLLLVSYGQKSIQTRRRNVLVHGDCVIGTFGRIIGFLYTFITDLRRSFFGFWKSLNRTWDGR